MQKILYKETMWKAPSLINISSSSVVQLDLILNQSRQNVTHNCTSTLILVYQGKGVITGKNAKKDVTLNSDV